MAEYTQEQATKDVKSAMNSVLLCEQIAPISDKTEEQIFVYDQNKVHLEIKMSKPLFVNTLNDEQKERIDNILK
tara:strand:+ start:1444 stop:1665 length:222 start_codon:yes stop_codon:yes gene_type:complete